jgi:hypothetical protein
MCTNGDDLAADLALLQATRRPTAVMQDRLIVEDQLLEVPVSVAHLHGERARDGEAVVPARHVITPPRRCHRASRCRSSRRERVDRTPAMEVLPDEAQTWHGNPNEPHIM